MGLAALVSTGRPEVLERLHSEVFDLWTDVFAELKEVQRQRDDEIGDEPYGFPFKDLLIAEIDTWSYSTILTAYWDQPAPSFFNGSEDTPEYDRRKNVSLVLCHSIDSLPVDHPVGL